MTARISLALTLHNHQPIGNFGWVFEEVFERAYRPMIEALGRYPRVRMGLHYSGPLLEWLRAERAGFIAEVRALVERGQVEILGGGLYEPILAALPQRDRVGQLERMAGSVEEAFGVRPRGAWLAERVWEPDLPTSLADAGYDWTILDDSHFRAAAIADDDLWGPYATDDQGRRLIVFGTDKGLRYRIPFQDVDEVIEYLREHATEAGDRLGTMGDDGEKFGAWPSTYEHCWGKGRWVERFFAALEANADWLANVRPSDWLAGHAAIGRASFPTGSYAEMGEWALPASEGLEFAEALREARDAKSPSARWLRGASWRNFQVKYREVNDLHKQMLRASEKVAAMPPGDERGVALDHLYRGQGNDCYWHGLFGGIYIAHMRAATLAHLIAAEDLADTAAGSLSGSQLLDLDFDGRDEIRLATPGQVVVVDPEEGAGIGSWDLRAARHAHASVLRRRPEAYHDTLRAHERALAKGRSKDGSATSIHERVQVKEAGLANRLVYDDFERRSGLIRILPPDSSLERWASGGRGDLGDLATGPFRLERLDADGVVLSRDGVVFVDGAEVPVRAESEFRVGGGRLDPSLEHRVTIENLGAIALDVRVGVEHVSTMLGGGGNPQAWWDIGGTRWAHDASRAEPGVDEIAEGNDWLGLGVRHLVMAPAHLDAWFSPIETISNSEAGFERVYQGSALLLSDRITLAPGETWTITLHHAASVARDSSAADPDPPATAPR